ncbi:MAG: hypothetical protein ACRYG7_01585 [Janthinobacterium lividum]
MKWYHYLACYFAGFWGLNLIPHLLHGISGEGFPTPFASPPAVGLSSPLVNVAWALSNLLLTYVLGRAGKISWTRPATLLAFFLGFATLAVVMAVVAAGRLHPAVAR